MSVPHSDIYCTQCDFHGCTDILHGGHWYYHEGTFCDLDLQYGWCQSCNDLVPMELFENLSNQLEVALDKLAYSVSWLLDGKVRLNFTKSNQKETESTISAVNSIKLMYQIYSQRKGKERCLRCGSYLVEPAVALNNLNKIDDDSEQTATGYRHPGCGGEFVLVPSQWRFHVAYHPKCYSFDGDFIDDDLVVP